eukprot:TRINITY_DN2754_c1_g2_i1.p1 TRINITY_DN2754_c1_g2~~TRINITY_DN2754_c1_g2_i1.p1  ORF type:complete len:317 (+),score=57.75 TRINITY_DN2754_c1_g2_i1:86-952(+)
MVHWERYTDDRSGAPYWFNSRTGETTWTDPHPAGAPPRAPPPASSGALTVAGPGPLSANDGAIEELKRQYTAAKQARDYSTSDRLRDELRRYGVDCERLCRRPGDWDCASCQTLCYATHTSCRKCGADKPESVEELKARWLAAKQARDFATSDALREKLRQRGVDCERLSARPGDWDCPQCNTLCFGSRDACRCGYVKGSGAGARPAAGGAPAGPPQSSSALPPGWEEHADDHGRKYWYNTRTQESTWQRPAGGGAGGGGKGARPPGCPPPAGGYSPYGDRGAANRGW